MQKLSNKKSLELKNNFCEEINVIFEKGYLVFSSKKPEIISTKDDIQ